MEMGSQLLNVDVDVDADADAALGALAALAHGHRLSLFRLLVQAGPAGMPAGAIADRLNVPNSSLSFHLGQLARAGLVSHERQHRSIIYRANYAAMNKLIGYLLESCCGGVECGAVNTRAESLPGSSESPVS